MASHEPRPPRSNDGRRPPVWLIHVIIIAVVASWVPFALVAESRTNKDTKPRIHIFQDMDVQPKLKAQASNPVFADQRAMRPRLEGTVARGELADADHYYRGYQTNDDGKPIIVKTGETSDYQWIADYPEQVTVTRQFVERGRERYNIFCAPCHGQSGQGNGMVHVRAEAVGASTTGWVAPSDLVGLDSDGTQTYGAAKFANGKLLHTISHGARSMRGYASQIPIEDRWAIVAYVRALQLSQSASVNDAPIEEIQKLRSR